MSDSITTRWWALLTESERVARALLLRLEFSEPRSFPKDVVAQSRRGSSASRSGRGQQARRRAQRSSLSGRVGSAPGVVADGSAPDAGRGTSPSAQRCIERSYARCADQELETVSRTRAVERSTSTRAESPGTRARGAGSGIASSEDCFASVDPVGSCCEGDAEARAQGAAEIGPVAEAEIPACAAKKPATPAVFARVAGTGNEATRSDSEVAWRPQRSCAAHRSANAHRSRRGDRVDGASCSGAVEGLTTPAEVCSSRCAARVTKARAFFEPHCVRRRAERF